MTKPPSAIETNTAANSTAVRISLSSRLTSRWPLLALPALFWLILFLGFPLLWVAFVSFLTKGVYGGVEWQSDWSHWQRTLSWVHLKIFWQSLQLALFTALLTTTLGFVLSWRISTLTSRTQKGFYLALMTIPSMINLVIRVYSIKCLVGFDGPIQWLLQIVLGSLKIEFDPFWLSQNQILVYFGMIITYLPYGFLPMYAAFEKFNFQWIEAAQDLGANFTEILFKVLIPSLRIPLIGSFTLVFIPSLGEFVIPDLLGGAKTLFLGGLISEQFLRARDWPTGSSIALLLILIVLLASTLTRKWWRTQ